MSRPFSVVLLIALLASGGCTSRPHAPALLDESVYQNDDAGFRLEIPKGWIVHARTNLPPGEPVAQERKLIGFKLAGSDRPASFEISCMDTPENADLVAHFTLNRQGPEAWKPLGPIESMSLANVPAQRLTLTFGAGANAQRKEVVSVRRGGRVYFFTLVSAPDDVGTREKVRRELSRITWKAD
jgi:hypothetical protein